MRTQLVGWRKGALLVAALVFVAACGGSGGSSGPSIRSGKELAERLQRAGLGCEDFVASPGGDGPVIGGGVCSVARAATRAHAASRTTWCETKPPQPYRRWRCEIAVDGVSDRGSRGIDGSFGFAVYRSEQVAEDAADVLGELQCHARPDPDLRVVQVRGPNWASTTLDNAAAEVVARALGATLYQVPC